MKFIGLYQDYNGFSERDVLKKNKVCAVIPAALIEFSLWGKNSNNASPAHSYILYFFPDDPSWYGFPAGWLGLWFWLAGLIGGLGWLAWLVVLVGLLGWWFWLMVLFCCLEVKVFLYRYMVLMYNRGLVDSLIFVVGGITIETIVVSRVLN